MKKILGAVLGLAFMLAPTMVFAAHNLTIEAIPSVSSVEAGDEFYVDFRVTENEDGFNSLTAYVDFDETKVEAVSYEDDDTSDYIKYTSAYGDVKYLFTNNFINGRVDFVPKKGDADYLGAADGVKNAGKLGRIKLSGFLDKNVDGYLQNYTETGRICQLKFKALASGTAEFGFEPVSIKHMNMGKSESNDVSVVTGSVEISGGSNETTTESVTETTTTGVTSQTTTVRTSTGGGGGGGGSRSSSDTTTTTTESTEVTTRESGSEITTDLTDADTDSNVSDTQRFSDVLSDFWGASYINDLAAKGVISGYSDGTFKPNAPVKRCDFIIMLMNGLEFDAEATDNFSDCEEGAYYYTAVAKAKALGIASGNGDGTFSPASEITRQDMMILARKALELKSGETLESDETVLDVFADKDEISPYAVDSLAAMVKAGVVSGKGDGIAPLATTTRAECAAIISRIM